MFKKSLEEAVEELHAQGRQLVLTSKRRKLKQLYTHLTAAACMAEGSEAAEEMRQELLELISAPVSAVQWDTFDDL